VEINYISHALPQRIEKKDLLTATRLPVIITITAGPGAPGRPIPATTKRSGSSTAIISTKSCGLPIRATISTTTSTTHCIEQSEILSEVPIYRGHLGTAPPPPPTHPHPSPAWNRTQLPPDPLQNRPPSVPTSHSTVPNSQPNFQIPDLPSYTPPSVHQRPIMYNPYNPQTLFILTPRHSRRLRLLPAGAQSSLNQ